MVVIDVDETDIYDDAYRYRELVARDDSGSITAVRRSPFAAQFQQGLLDKSLYLHRLLAKAYFTKIEYPRLLGRHTKDWAPDFLAISRLPTVDARRQYAGQIAYFAATLDDLTQTVLRQMGRRDGLVYIHHPHLEHFNPAGGSFNDVVSATLREVSLRHGVRYYDATEDLKAEFGKAPERYYIPNDVHFNAAGQRAYGIAVAKYLAGMGARTE
jgi:YHS domain-containing protein